MREELIERSGQNRNVNNLQMIKIGIVLRLIFIDNKISKKIHI